VPVEPFTALLKTHRLDDDSPAFEYPNGAVRAVAYSPEIHDLALVTRDGALAVWSPGGVRAQFLTRNSPDTRYAFSPDGKAVASCDPTRGEDVASVKLWKVREYLEVGDTSEHTSWRMPHPNALAFSPDGKTLAVGGGEGLMRVYDVESGRLRVVCQSGPGMIHFLAVTPDGRTLVSVGHDFSIQFRDLATGLESRRPTIASLLSPPNCLAFSPDGKNMVFARTPQGSPPSESGYAEFGNVAWDQRVIQMLPTSHLGLSLRTRGGKFEGRVMQSRHAILALAFSPDGHFLASVGGEHGGEGEAKLWDAGTGELIADLKGHKRYVTCLAFSPDSRFLVTAGGWAGGPGGEVKIWELNAPDAPRPVERDPRR
jgi:WD40 repeat protein